MKLTRCDNHPDRNAAATFRVIELAPGARPILLGYDIGAHMLIDLCKECADKVRVVKGKTNA